MARLLARDVAQSSAHSVAMKRWYLENDLDVLAKLQILLLLLKAVQTADKDPTGLVVHHLTRIGCRARVGDEALDVVHVVCR